MVAHFGLGERTQVDRLEVRWPSGQVDVLADIPADQKIRVFEGRNAYHVVHPTTWKSAPPDSLVAGSTAKVTATVRPALFEAGARISRVAADLSELGGPAEAPLREAGDGTWRLESTFAVEVPNGFKTLADGLAANQTEHLAEDRDGYLWIAAATGGVSRFDGDEFRTYTTRDGLPADSVFSLLVDRRGQLWCATYRGLCLFDGERFH